MKDMRRLHRPQPGMSKGFISAPNIDQLLDNSADFQLVSFIDVYSGNNQISNFRPDRVKIALMTEKANYQYNIMPFRLKNVRTNY